MTLRVVVDFIYLCALPFVLVYLLVVSRGFSRAKYRRGIVQKLGAVPRRDDQQASLWVHAVSVGEVLTAAPLVKALRARLPGYDVSLSVSTYTGFEVARKNLSELTIFYFPLDFSVCVRRAFRRRRPDAVILVELEVWPNFLLAARNLDIPVLVVNGRITERSARRYACLGSLARRLFQSVSGYAAQNDTYRERFVRLGVDPRRVRVLGNLKHDRPPPTRIAEGAERRKAFGWSGKEHVVVVCGSTHPGEERILCDAVERLTKTVRGVRLVIAPRHVERFPGDEAPDVGWGGLVLRWSRIRETLLKGGGPLPPEAAVVVDTVGDLEMFYAMADIVFVGGSLVPHGGQNLFEPAALGKAIVFGPHFWNFQTEGDLLLEEGGAVRVESGEQVPEVFGRLARDPAERERLGHSALRVLAACSGATERHLQWLAEELRLSFQAAD